MEHQGLEANFTMTTQYLPEKLEFFKNLKIGRKLTIGFGLLVMLMFLSVGMIYLGSNRATTKINRADDLRVPAALTASDAQANLLRMLGDVRGYLALGDPQYRDSYNQSVQAFVSVRGILNDREVMDILKSV